MRIKKLKKEARHSLKKNYWSKVFVAFIITFDINIFFSIFSGEAIFPLLKLREFDFETIKNVELQTLHTLIFEHHFSDKTELLISFVVILFEIFVLSVFKVGGTRYFIKSQTCTPKVSELLFAFNGKNKAFKNIIAVELLKSIKILLWSMVFIVPGVINSFDYVAVHYVLALCPHLKPKKALKVSKAMMKGNRIRFILMELSFIGWDIVEFLSFGILKHFYITPYKLITHDEFFTEIKNKGVKKGIKEFNVFK